MDLQEEEILGSAVGEHWYYKAKAAALLKNLRGYKPQNILDIGAGSGFFTKTLLEKTAATTGFCVDTGYATDREELYCGKQLEFRREIIASNADLVLAMDVIEHVADEAKLMRPYVDLVKPGTRFIITVPAFQFLWSSHDVFLRHYRRYSLKQLQAALARCNLTVDWCHYYYGSVFPLAAAIRLSENLRGRSLEPKSQLSKQSAFANTLLSAFCGIERPLMRFNRLFGLTVFAGGHKPL